MNRDHGSDPLKSVIAEYAELRREKVKVEARLTQRIHFYTPLRGTQRYAKESESMNTPCNLSRLRVIDLMCTRIEKYHSLNRIEVLDFTLRTFAAFAMNDLDSI